MQDAIAAVPRGPSFQGLTHGLFQNRQLERLAQYRKLRLRRLHDVAIPAGEKNRDLRIVVADFLSERDTVHAAGHDDVAEDEVDLVAALQPVQRIGGIFRAQGLIAKLFDQRRRDVGNLDVVLDDIEVADVTASTSMSSRTTRTVPCPGTIGCVGGASTALNSAACRRGK